jgi:hypothetical protein
MPSNDTRPAPQDLIHRQTGQRPEPRQVFKASLEVCEMSELTFETTHEDVILGRVAHGAWLMACEPVSGTVLPSGGRRYYPPGARFMVRNVVAGAIACADDGMRHVTFNADALGGLELAPARP